MIPRHPDLLSRETSALLVIDMQEKLVPVIHDRERILWNISRLVDAALLLHVPVFVTEQYPAGLGATVAALRDRLSSPFVKRMFSMRECDALFENLRHGTRHHLLVTGIETHVCVQQSIFDCLGEGYRVSLAVDATGSRNPLDAEIARGRLAAHGVTLTTTEAALFEWCETSTAPEFKAISQLVRQLPPGG